MNSRDQKERHHFANKKNLFRRFYSKNSHCARSPSAEDHHLTPGATGAFQQYVVVQRNAIAQLPSSIRTSVGVVLPLGISTASAGLFQKDYLNLPFPSPSQQPAPKPLNRILLIWGGSSSVGSCAIQLAKAAGAIIITTASPKNFEYVKQLGAEEVFDYRAEDVEDQIVKWLQSKTVLGAFHARGGNGAVQTCARIVDRSQGKAIVVSVRGIPSPGDGGGDVPKAVRTKTSKLCLVPLVIHLSYISAKRGNELTAVDL